MERDTRSQRFPLGSALPAFSLPNVDGRKLGDDYLLGAKAALVVFTCNHCPYVKGSEQMLIEIARRLESRGLKTVSISANDAAQYPEDSFDKMKQHAQQLKLPYPYLYDESQQVARAFDAACTPECFLFDEEMRLVYQGALTDKPKDSGAPRQDLLTPAIEAVLQGRKPNPDFHHPIGCSIKWR